jgi:uncharacterized protein (TIGR02246 family)
VTSATVAPADERAIHDLLGRLGTAWAAGDGDAYAAAFAEDARYVTAPGFRDVGRAAIAGTHRKIFGTVFKNTRLGRDYPVELQPVSPDVVLVHGSGAILFAGEDERRVPPNGLLTMVVVRDGAGWKVASFSNTATGSARNVRFFWRFLTSRRATRRSR